MAQIANLERSSYYSVGGLCLLHYALVEKLVESTASEKL